MTKMICDRCGKDCSHDQNQVFSPGQYAGSLSAQLTDSKRTIGTPKLYDVCTNCRKLVIEAFDTLLSTWHIRMQENKRLTAMARQTARQFKRKTK